MKKFMIMLVLVLFVMVACAPAIATAQPGTLYTTPQPTPVTKSNAPVGDAVSRASSSTLYRYVDEKYGNVCYFVVPDYSSDSISLFCMKGDN